MCLLDDPIKIDRYFKCFDNSGVGNADIGYFSCVNQLDIDIFRKQNVSCYKGNILKAITMLEHFRTEFVGHPQIFRSMAIAPI